MQDLKQLKNIRDELIQDFKSASIKWDIDNLCLNLTDRLG